MTTMAISPNPAAANSGIRAKAQKAGTEFEAVLLNTVLGAIERSFSELPGTKLQHETEAYSGMGMQALTSGLARAGGIGIGKIISAALEKAEMPHAAH